MLRSLLLASVLAVPLVSPAAEAKAPGASAPPSIRPQSEPLATGASADADAARLEAEIAKELGQPTAPASGSAQPGAAAATPGSPAAPAPAAAGGNPFARLLLMPDISAIGSGALAYDSYDVEARSPRGGLYGQPDRPTFLFDELELGLQAVVDPYLRAAVFLSFGEHGAEVEEAYVTTLSLPAGFQVRAGKLFTPFGRENTQHPHSWDFVDAPLARSRLLAEEALAGPGVEVAWLAPLPWFAELRVAGQNTAPAEDDPAELTGTARLSQYLSLSDATTLGVGLSAARRGEGHPGAFRDLGGGDLYLRIRPTAGRAYLALQGELYARRFRGVEGVASETETGWWSQAFLRRSAWWGYGVRYERAPGAGEVGGTEQRLGGLVSWMPSEFQRVRLQVSWDRLPGGHDGVEALLHLEFGIGAHGAHTF